MATGRESRISISAARKTTRIAEGKTMEMRFETFNSLNHAQFNGQGSVDGNVNSPTFGEDLASP